MIHIKRFVEKVSLTESKQSKDIVLPIAEARGLRDEIAKLLSDLYLMQAEEKQETVTIEVKGRSFK